MTRRQKGADGEMVSIPSRNMKVIFKGCVVLKEIIIGFTKLNVSYFNLLASVSDALGLTILRNIVSNLWDYAADVSVNMQMRLFVLI